jgi:hypothetical protein
MGTATISRNDRRSAMAITGRCYCGALRYAAEGAPRFQGQCHCRECQYISGGGANYFMIMPAEGFRYTQGTPKQFQRGDIPNPGTREFCGTCGTHIITRAPMDNSMVVLKVGTLDDPSAYAGPQAAIQVADKQPWHLIAEGLATFPRFPGR